MRIIKSLQVFKEWRSLLAQAARDEASAAVAGRMARGWVVVASLVLAVVVGAGGALVGARGAVSQRRWTGCHM
jgi:hypothetical protein